jgi:hypothetical protein
LPVARDSENLRDVLSHGVRIRMSKHGDGFDSFSFVFPVTNRAIWRSWPVLPFWTKHDMLMIRILGPQAMSFFWCHSAKQRPRILEVEHVLLKSLQPVHPGTCELIHDAQTVMLSPVHSVHFSCRSICSPFCPWSNFYRAAVDRPRCPVAALRFGRGLFRFGGQEVLALRSYKGFDAIPEAQGLYDPRNEKDR